MPVDPSLVGLVIGAKGATIHRLQQESRCKIQVDMAEKPEEIRIVRISSNDQAKVDHAQQLVNDVINVHNLFFNTRCVRAEQISYERN